MNPILRTVLIACAAHVSTAPTLAQQAGPAEAPTQPATQAPTQPATEMPAQPTTGATVTDLPPTPVFTNERIVNGDNAPAGSAPWMAQLFTSYAYDCAELQSLNRQASTQSFAARATLTHARQCLEPGADPRKVLAHSDSWQFTHKCGGSYIGNGWVLTAAHCFMWQGEMPTVADQQMYLKNWRVRLGTITITEGQVFTIDRIVIPAAFRKGRKDNMAYDIALLHIAVPPVLGPGSAIKPIKLASPEMERPGKLLTPTGTTVFVTGWGSQTAHASGVARAGVDLGSLVLKKSELTVTDTCNSKAGAPAAREYFKTHKQAITAICAEGVAKDGKATGDCFGDSGGPITQYRPDGTPTNEPVARTYLLVGVVSGGPACGQTGAPGVYTSVAKMKAWIDSAIASTGTGYSER